MCIAWHMVKDFLDRAFFRHFIRLLPLGVVLAIVRTSAVFFAPITPVAWRLWLCGPLKISFGRMLVLGYLRSVARIERYVLLLKSDQIPDITRHISVKEKQHLSQARESGRGVILVTIHSYYFRLLMRWTNEVDNTWRPYLIKKFPRKPDMHQPKAECLHQIQLKIFSDRLLDTGSGTRQAARILKAGGTIILAQDIPDKTAVTVRFLNKETPISLGAARLAEMTDALIVPIAPSGLLRGWFWMIRIWPAIDPRGNDTLGRLIAAMEEIIRTNPETWGFWWHFWRT